MAELGLPAIDFRKFSQMTEFDPQRTTLLGKKPTLEIKPHVKWGGKLMKDQ